MKRSNAASGKKRPAAFDADRASNPRPYRPLGTGKIAPDHLDRLAIVYVRQSTVQQVLDHRESTQRQYALADHAVALGWPADRVLVIDEDQGRSGQTAAARAGFQQILTEVTLGHVGIVLGLEMSRLARSSKDCHHLIEVCGIFRTLLADQDGVYDANDPNDRLLLGLKGTISEVELHTMRSRLERGRFNKAERGELFHGVPRGYIRTASNQVEFDPDEQVRAVVRLVFDKFDELGSAQAVFHYLLRHDIRLGGRQHGGPQRGQVHWCRPSLPAIYDMLHNPFYAGAYVYGRRPIDPKRKRADQPRSGRTLVPAAEWKVFLPDRLPAYISWERYLANQQRLQQNQSRAATLGTPRQGACLLTGLLRCRCGRRLQANYSDAAFPAYSCNRNYREGTAADCPRVPAAVVDGLVAEQVLFALEPASLESSLQALADVAKERQRLERHWQQQLQRARYETEKAERRYQLVDPANRLVANTLEQRWEAALREQRQLEEAYHRFTQQQPSRVTEAEQQRLRALAQDIPGLWHSPHTTVQQRKEIVRCLVDKVVATVSGRSELLTVTIHWAGGFVTEHTAIRPVNTYEQLSGFAALKQRILELRALGHSAAEIAAQLNAEGWRTAKRRTPFAATTIRDWLRHRGLNKVPCPAAHLQRNEWRIKDLAAKLGMKRGTLSLWRRRGWLKARWVAAEACWIIWADAKERNRLRKLVALQHNRAGLAYPKELVHPQRRQS
jgi:DNA invertase Pin-like site-specific DNA recombinase